MKRFKLFYVIPGILLIIGLILTASLIVMTENNQIDFQILRFEQVVNEYQTLIQKEINNNLNQVNDLGTIFKINPNITRDDYHKLTDRILNQKSNIILATSWNPIVRDQITRTQLEKQTQEYFSNPNITFKGFDENGTLSISPQKDFYVPVLYSEPIETTKNAILLDVNSERIRREAIERAINTNKTSATKLIDLLIGKRGFLTYNPISKESGGKIIGFSTGIFTLVDLLKAGFLTIVNDAKPSQIVVIDERDKFITFDFNSDNNVNILFQSLTIESNVFIRNVTVTFADKDLVLLFKSQLVETNTISIIIGFVIPIIFLILSCLTLILIKYVKNQIEYNLTEQHVRTRHQFIDYIFHEIRVPLNTIIVGVENLKKLNKFDGQNIKIVRIISSSLEQTKNILNDILDINKIESGKFDIVREYIHFSQFIEEIAFSFTQLSDLKEIDFQVIIDDKLKKKDVELDAQRIGQCVNNYLSNAFKYTGQKGKIIFEIKKIQENSLGNSVIQFMVHDNGCGISKENQKLLFKPYVQILENKSEVGTGLGLAIAKQISELHGGKAWVESVEGEWSKFYFTIESQISRRKKRKKNLKKKINTLDRYAGLKFLIVDDNESSCYMIEEYLKFHKIDSDSARNGKQALELFAKNKYDLILMDRQMPVMDGIETTKKIRATGSNIPIVALTGMAALDDQQVFREAGANDTLSKPLNFDQFATILGKHFTNL